MSKSNHKPYMISEIGLNHNGDLELACELIKKAKVCGADVAKFQLYDAKNLFPKEGNEWYEYNCKTELSFEDVEMLDRVCKEEGIEFMASVFDVKRIRWLEDLNVKRYKIASRTVVDHPKLCEEIISSGKEVFCSLGFWEGVEFPFGAPNSKLRYIHCVSNYPNTPEDLRKMPPNFSEKSYIAMPSLIKYTCQLRTCSMKSNL